MFICISLQLFEMTQKEWAWSFCVPMTSVKLDTLQILNMDLWKQWIQFPVLFRSLALSNAYSKLYQNIIALWYI